MPYVVTRLCRDCVDTACVAVCPVDCFYLPKKNDDGTLVNPQLFNQTYISEECIDCGACVPECPWDAIVESDDMVPKAFRDAGNPMNDDVAINALSNDNKDWFIVAKADTNAHKPTPQEIEDNKKKWSIDPAWKP